MFVWVLLGEDKISGCFECQSHEINLLGIFSTKEKAIDASKSEKANFYNKNLKIRRVNIDEIIENY